MESPSPAPSPVAFVALSVNRTPLRGLATQDTYDVSGREQAERAVGGGGEGGDVRGEEDVLGAEERVVGSGGLDVEDIGGETGGGAGREGGAQGGHVDPVAAGGVKEEGAGLHRAELAGGGEVRVACVRHAEVR